MRVLSIIFLIFNWIFVSAQDLNTSITLSGQLVDSITNEGVEYVNIGIPNTPVGCISGSNGFFSMDLDTIQYRDSTIRISAIGYEHAEYAIGHFNFFDSVIVFLKPEIYHIDEIVFEGQHLKLKNYGIKRGGDRIIKGMLHGLEKAYFIPVKKERIKIKDVNFCLRSEFDTVTFRINIYNKADNAPNNRINTENLLFTQVSDKTGWISCDLSERNLFFDNDFYLAIELLPELNNDTEVRSVFKAKLGAKGKLFSRDYLDSWMEIKGLGIPININYFQIEP
ncbi:MAG: carboxypeptidase-like regulatory domain-containing protein [Bacteroidota bacterium]